jgi:transposase-like protein
VIEGGLSKAAAARQFNTTPNTVAKWVDRFRADGVAGLQDRSSRPRLSPSQAAPAIRVRGEALRRPRGEVAVERGSRPLAAFLNRMDGKLYEQAARSGDAIANSLGELEMGRLHGKRSEPVCAIPMTGLPD